MSQSVIQSVSLAVGRSVGRSFCLSVCLSVGRSVGRSVGPSVGRSASRSVSQSVSQSESQSVRKSVSQSQTVRQSDSLSQINGLITRWMNQSYYSSSWCKEIIKIEELSVSLSSYKLITHACSYSRRLQTPVCRNSCRIPQCWYTRHLGGTHDHLWCIHRCLQKIRSSLSWGVAQSETFQGPLPRLNIVFVY